MKSVRLIAGLLILAIIGLAIPACNTVEGAGEDIEKGGEALQRAAD